MIPAAVVVVAAATVFLHLLQQLLILKSRAANPKPAFARPPKSWLENAGLFMTSKFYKFMRSDRHLLSGARRATPQVTVSTRITHADKTFSQSAPKAVKDLQLILLVAKARKSYILHYTPKAKESTRSYRC